MADVQEHYDRIHRTHESVRYLEALSSDYEAAKADFDARRVQNGKASTEPDRMSFHFGAFRDAQQHVAQAKRNKEDPVETFPTAMEPHLRTAVRSILAAERRKQGGKLIQVWQNLFNELPKESPLYPVYLRVLMEEGREATSPKKGKGYQPLSREQATELMKRHKKLFGGEEPPRRK